METRTTAGENTIKFCVIFLVTLWKVSSEPEVTLAWRVPVLEPTRSTDIIRSNTNALRSERKNVIQKEHIGKSVEQ